MKFKLTSRRSKKAGMPPGSLIFTGERKAERTTIHVTAFDEHTFVESQTTSVSDALAVEGKAAMLWINVDGLQDTEVVKSLGEHFNLHPLALEDVLNPEQRPRAEHYDEFVVCILKSFSPIASSKEFEAEQISIFMGKGFVLTFQEKEGDVFRVIRDRLRNNGSKLRRLGPDFLLYTLIDTVVDNYFSVLEDFGERIEKLESAVVSNPQPKRLHELYELKRAGLYLRRCVWPLREAIMTLERGDCPFMKHETIPFLRDVYSHLVEIIDTIETFREMLSSMLDVYLSSVSNKMNTVIKVLTIITTIFMPLSLIAGIYGMNFKHMPELDWEYGYPFAIGLMVAIAGTMLALFNKRQWL